MPELELTLPAILAGGSVAAAAFVTGMVEVIKRLVPLVSLRDWEPQLAALLAAVLVVAALTGVPQPTDTNGWAGLILTAVLSWYGITRVAMGIYDDLTGAPRSLRAASSTTPSADDSPTTGG